MKSISKFCYINYVPIIMALALNRMFGYDANNFLDYPLFLILGYQGVVWLFGKSKNTIETYFTSLVLYCFFTGFFYSFNGVPFRCFFLTAQLLLIPMFFFYFGSKYISYGDAFEKMYMYGCAFCFIFGFYLYISRPSFYLAAVQRISANLSDAVLAGREAIDILRFGSFFLNSYPIAFFSVPTLVLSLYYLYQKKANNIVLYIVAIVSFIAASICIQRASMAGALLTVIFFILYKGKGGKLKIIIILSVFVAFVSVLFVTSGVSSTDSYATLDFQFNDMLSRFNLYEALNERSYQYQDFSRSSILSNILGLGLGSCGHQARFYGLQTINDNQYMLLFHEIGMIGCSLFSIVLVKSIVKGFRSFKIFYPQLLIIGFFLFAFIGAEPLEVTAVSCIFWFSIGRIWNRDYYIKRKAELAQRI